MPGFPSVWRLTATSSILKFISGRNNKLFHSNLLPAGRGGGAWNIIRAKLLACSDFKRPDAPNGAPLPPTLSCKLLLESAYFLIQGPLTRSPLTLSPHKCVTCSTAFLFKKMRCPPWLCRRIWGTQNLSQNKGVNLRNQLLLSGSRPCDGPRNTQENPRLPRGSGLNRGAQSKGHAQARKPTLAQAPLQTNEVRSLQWAGLITASFPVVLIWSQTWNPLEYQRITSALCVGGGWEGATLDAFLSGTSPIACGSPSMSVQLVSTRLPPVSRGKLQQFFPSGARPFMLFILGSIQV